MYGLYRTSIDFSNLEIRDRSTFSSIDKIYIYSEFGDHRKVLFSKPSIKTVPA